MFCSFFPRNFPIVFVIQGNFQGRNIKSETIRSVIISAFYIRGKFRACNCHQNNILQFCSKVHIKIPRCNMYYYFLLVTFNMDPCRNRLNQNIFWQNNYAFLDFCESVCLRKPKQNALISEKRNSDKQLSNIPPKVNATVLNYRRKWRYLHKLKR